MTVNFMKPGMDAKENEPIFALLKFLSLGNKEIEQGKFRDAENVFAELDKRIDEDDLTPNDTVAWETINAEAQARWKR